jgi:hypothetical protein
MKAPVLTDRLYLSSGSRVITEKEGAATQLSDSGIKRPGHWQFPLNRLQYKGTNTDRHYILRTIVKATIRARANNPGI